jgi:hypothetical protein
MNTENFVWEMKCYKLYLFLNDFYPRLVSNYYSVHTFINVKVGSCRKRKPNSTVGSSSLLTAREV